MTSNPKGPRGPRQTTGRGSGPASPPGARGRTVHAARAPARPRQTRTLTSVPAAAPPALLGEAGAPNQRPSGGLERVHGCCGRRRRQNSVRENFPRGPGGERTPRSSPPGASSAPTSDGAGRGPARPRPLQPGWPLRAPGLCSPRLSRQRKPKALGARSFPPSPQSSYSPPCRNLRVREPPPPPRA